MKDSFALCDEDNNAFRVRRDQTPDTYVLEYDTVMGGLVILYGHEYGVLDLKGVNCPSLDGNATDYQAY